MPPPSASIENAVAAAAPSAVCCTREPPAALPEWTKHITASLTSCPAEAGPGLAPGSAVLRPSRNGSTTGRPLPYHPAQPRAGEAECAWLLRRGTRLADAAGGVTDEAWANAATHYDDDQLAALVSLIALINTYNRFNVITRQPAGDYQPGQWG
jgi:hypothetical protein